MLKLGGFHEFYSLRREHSRQVRPRRGPGEMGSARARRSNGVADIGKIILVAVHSHDP